MYKYGTEEFMKKRIVLLAMAIFFGVPQMLSATSISVEGETGWQANNERLGSFYLWLDTERINCTIRFFQVDPVEVKQGEFACGPTFQPTLFTKPFLLKLWGGVTTENNTMVGGTLQFALWDREIFYILDPKLPDDIYQKLFVQLNRKGWLYLRIETLQIKGSAVFVRFGPELRYLFSKKFHLYVHPYVDVQGDDLGFHAGFRLLGW